MRRLASFTFITIRPGSVSLSCLANHLPRNRLPLELPPHDTRRSGWCTRGAYNPSMTRIDVWLWSVRLFKTRSLATKAVTGGHIRLNGDPVKPAHTIRPGDRVTVKEPGWTREFEVVELLSKRVGAPIARKAYVDHSPERPAFLNVPVAKRDRGAGRPTKKDRRAIDKLRGSGD